MGQKFEIEAIGQVLARGIQRYECVAIKPTTRKDGTQTSYAVLKSQCADCGADFTFTSALHGAAFNPNRRCDKHKAAGVPLGIAKSFLADKAQTEIKRLKAEKADLARRLTQAERSVADMAKRLARYELTTEEAKRFADHCAAMAKERRARLEKARRARASVFD